MDRVVLIQSANAELTARLVQWAKLFDLGVECIQFRGPAEADDWWLRPDARADLALVDADVLVDPKLRSFWFSKDGGALPVVVLADATQEQAMAWGRKPQPVPETVLRLPADAETVGKILAGVAPGNAWLWDPHRKGGKGTPAYLAFTGGWNVLRSAELSEIEKIDRAGVRLVAAELTAGSSESALEWREWRRFADLSSIPSLTAVGPEFVSALRNYSALAAGVPEDRVWRKDSPSVYWDEKRSELRLEVERFRSIRNFLRGADRFLRRKTPGHAITSLEHAVSLHPSCAALWDRLGDTWQAMGQPDKARDALRRAIQLEPGHRDRWTKLAALLSSGDEKAYVIVLREGTARFPWDFELRERLGDHFLRRGDRAASGIELGRARLLRP